MIRILGVIILAVLVPSLPWAQGLESLSVHFLREHTESGGKEVTSGLVYYHQPSTVILRVTYPLEQWMVFEDTVTTIYYPASRQAFRIISRFGSYPPFVQAFIGVAERDYGLSVLGYRVRDYNVRADTLISHWAPPKGLSLFLGETILKIKDDKIVYTESRTVRGETLRKSVHKKHVRYQGTYFPMEILTTEYSRTDSTFEKVIFSEPKFNSPLPEEVLTFHIPTDVEVKEVRW
ncbi:hypothetical protein E3J38_09055 [candidate division TA06 bacterium]|uniref:Uncharacterized protein n=1 Tax=candidate division TA06 bacterium TaxID=2250710 RepID=A0A523XFJ6_UNCT6|nr:MAG: hypothetical protein E3J38_09055 [candidate division TA06 bacterium]